MLFDQSDFAMSIFQHCLTKTWPNYMAQVPYPIMDGYEGRPNVGDMNEEIRAVRKGNKLATSYSPVSATAADTQVRLYLRGKLSAEGILEKRNAVTTLFRIFLRRPSSRDH